MQILISPAKRLDESSPTPEFEPTQPAFLAQAEKLAAVLSQKSAADLGALMSISDDLATLNHQRYQDFTTPFTEQNARPALSTFQGDVYAQLELARYSQAELNYAQDHLRILSGLYGVLRPFDLMQPYRLEMGTKLAGDWGKNLYQFWGEQLTQHLAKSAGPIINLASNEYFDALQPAAFGNRLITVKFQQMRENGLKSLGIMNKKARGQMVNWLIQQKITDPAQFDSFNVDGYVFQPEASSAQERVFIKDMT